MAKHLICFWWHFKQISPRIMFIFSQRF